MKQNQKSGEQASISTQGSILTLQKETAASHLFWLLETHGLEDRGCDVSENTVVLLEGPALGGVGHDEWYLVSCVGSLWLAVFEFHFFSISTPY